jgi:hypothetical protein
MDEKTFTRVVFKMTPREEHTFPRYVIESECIAFLLDCPANPHYVLSYVHVGQHGEASLGFYRDCKLATPEQYADLKAELQSIGYRLIIRKRWMLKH